MVEVRSTVVSELAACCLKPFLDERVACGNKKNEQRIQLEKMRKENGNKGEGCTMNKEITLYTSVPAPETDLLRRGPQPMIL